MKRKICIFAMALMSIQSHLCYADWTMRHYLHANRFLAEVAVSGIRAYVKFDCIAALTFAQNRAYEFDTGVHISASQNEITWVQIGWTYSLPIGCEDEACIGQELYAEAVVGDGLQSEDDPDHKIGLFEKPNISSAELRIEREASYVDRKLYYTYKYYVTSLPLDFEVVQGPNDNWGNNLCRFTVASEITRSDGDATHAGCVTDPCKVEDFRYKYQGDWKSESLSFFEKKEDPGHGTIVTDSFCSSMFCTYDERNLILCSTALVGRDDLNKSVFIDPTSKSSVFDAGTIEVKNSRGPFGVEAFGLSVVETSKLVSEALVSEDGFLKIDDAFMGGFVDSILPYYCELIDHEFDENVEKVKFILVRDVVAERVFNGKRWIGNIDVWVGVDEYKSAVVILYDDGGNSTGVRGQIALDNVRKSFGKMRSDRTSREVNVGEVLSSVWGVTGQIPLIGRMAIRPVHYTSNQDVRDENGGQTAWLVSIENRESDISGRRKVKHSIVSHESGKYLFGTE